MQLRREGRVNQFQAVQGQIKKISAEIAGQSEYEDSITNVTVNENDLSLKKLDEYQNELQRLQNENAKLNSTVEPLQEEKQKRLEKLHHVGQALKNLWSLMDTPYGDRYLFSSLIDLLSVSSEKVSDSGSLTLDIIQQAEAKVKRLDQLKASKMKELFLKKYNGLEEIWNKLHMVIPSI
ncbi:hypothetical protein CRYUN_Cryun21dG0050000 [Craigia yunnanensis]